MKQFADQHDGVFDPLPEPSDIEMKAFSEEFFPYFLQNMLPSQHVTEDEREQNMRREFQSTILGRAQVELPYKRFKLAFLAQQLPTIAPGPEEVFEPYVTVSCALKPLTTAVIVMRNEGSCGATGLPVGGGFDIFPQLAPFGKFLRPKASERRRAVLPTNTYFCPFINPTLQKQYKLRSSSVTVGRAFAENAEIERILLTVSGLNSLYLGQFNHTSGEEYSLIARAVAERDINQMQLLNELMIAVLELAQHLNLVASE